MRNRNIIYICLVLSLFFFLSTEVSAVSCDSGEIADLKALSNRINYQSNYVGYIDYQHRYQTYEIYFEGLGNDFFITDSDNNYAIRKDKDSFYVQSGSSYFKIYSSKCNTYLRLLEVNLPRFNEKSLSSLCVGIVDKVEECGEWYQGDLTDSQLKKKVEEYKSSLEVDDISLTERVIDWFYDNYIVSLMGIGLIVLIIIVLIIRHRKKSTLE